MKILFYDTQSYDRESFDRTKEQFPEIEVEYLKTRTCCKNRFPGKGLRCRVRLRKLRCRNKNREALHEAGVKLILMRCAGFNNVDLKQLQKSALMYAVYRVIPRRL